jgi:O-antigen ligase
VLNVVAALLAFLFLRRTAIRPGRLAAIALGSALAAVAVVYLVAPAFFEAYVWRWRGSAEYLFEAPGKILSGRLDNWRLLGEFALRSPAALLTGIGYKTLPYTTILGRPVVADNMYFAVLVETGVLGLAALLALNFQILRAGYRAARHPDPRAAFFGTWIFCFWTGQVVQMASGDLLTYWRALPLYLWVLAVAVRESGGRPD